MFLGVVSLIIGLTVMAYTRSDRVREPAMVLFYSTEDSTADANSATRQALRNRLVEVPHVDATMTFSSRTEIRIQIYLEDSPSRRADVEQLLQVASLFEREHPNLRRDSQTIQTGHATPDC